MKSRLASWLRRVSPRSVRGQLIVGLVVLELVVLGLFVMLLLRAEQSELRVRTGRRAIYEASLSAAEAAAALRDGDTGDLAGVIAGARHDPGIQGIEILDPSGKVLAVSLSGKSPFPALSLSQAAGSNKPLLSIDHHGKVNAAIAAMRVHGTLYGYVIVLPSEAADRHELHSTLRITFFAAVIALAGCTWLAGILANSLARPLVRLLDATRQLILNPEDKTALPLPANVDNEIGELTAAFHRLIMIVQEQRAQSGETLALLDSILANAPIGFIFFDRRHHVVRVNTFLAGTDAHHLYRYVGKTAVEIFPGEAGASLEEAVSRVLASGEPVRDLELTASLQGNAARARTWIAHLYPIHTEDEQVRWVGAVLVDTTQRHQAEEALRKSEKLAAAGRLAASIAHEINNPLEAVTNLLYLLHQADLDEDSARYVAMAQHEVARVSEVAQQTLRFYRQSTLPSEARLSELMDSVLALHQGRLVSLQIKVIREYEDTVPLFCFAGEVRQIFTNLVTNAVDAMMPGGGHLTVRIRPARSQREPGQRGVLVTIADTGCGIDGDHLPHIFEPFYTTKDATGTGLGLWVSAQILRKHQAAVALRSFAAKGDRNNRATGTVFRIFFPHLEEPKAIASAPE
ncbi:MULTISPECIES: ATP-binding protein [Acidobacterium]|uniref:histidine kinase n=1 Tax=Acidobacterium capsulatum (strain ATCC 51196 / DSM 11244 / BCRC 80197 / JCM 7670 / NBRC 15755 / NCIMB 13165 / 161) TaxID=240015 RepID=C1F6I4_ACIC5|nr:MULTISPECIES: ATP-binding protein [Acidobacterium]ACO34017.1 sensor histidine kinase, putative [Acidobacterium capsulatum ATCC 51196]HCT60873.1 HAMP domain-containing protein [Acidobacterium sp.]